MKNLKKALALAIVFTLLAAGAAGCGQKNQGASGSGGAEADTRTPRQEAAKGQEEGNQAENDNTNTENTADTTDSPKKEQDLVIQEEPELEEFVEEDVIVDENGTPLTEEELADIDGGDPSVGVPVPFVEYTDYDIFLEDSEIEVEAPTSLPFQVEYTSYLLYSDGMYEIRYEDEEGNTMSFRKGKGSDDISGVYLDFDKKGIAEINGRDVKFCRLDGRFMLATWTDGSFAYSVYADPGYELGTMKEVVSSVKAAAD